MALLLDERTTITDAGLLLGDGPLTVRCRITVEWLRGIDQPTWYGYIVPVEQDVRLLPGRYRLQLEASEVDVLIRRPARLDAGLCFPFWGLDAPPALPSSASFALEPNWDVDDPATDSPPASR